MTWSFSLVVQAVLGDGRVLKVSYDGPSVTFGWLQDQVLANYISAPGDSGGPIYRLEEGRWIMLGIHVGRYTHATHGLVRRFSPVSGIRTELGVVPRTK